MLIGTSESTSHASESCLHGENFPNQLENLVTLLMALRPRRPVIIGSLLRQPASVGLRALESGT